MAALLIALGVLAIAAVAVGHLMRTYLAAERVLEAQLNELRGERVEMRMTVGGRAMFTVWGVLGNVVHDHGFPWVEFDLHDARTPIPFTITDRFDHFLLADIHSVERA